MPATVNVFGRQIPRTPLLLGGALALGVTGYILYKKHQAGTTATPAGSSFAYGYGSAYGYGQYAYGLGIASYGYGLGNYGAGSYAYGPYGYGGMGAVGVGVSPQPVGVAQAPITNAEWAAAAEAYLTQTAGYDATTVAAALGKFLTGGTLTSDQGAIVQAALAFENNPPTAGPSGFPPGIHLETSTGQTGTTPAGGTVAVPNVKGQLANQAIATLTAAGLTYKLSSVRNPISEYVVNSQTPGAGTKVAKGSRVDLGIAVKK